MSLLQSSAYFSFRNVERVSFSRNTSTNAASLTEKAPAVRVTNPDIWGKSPVDSLHCVRGDRGNFHDDHSMENPIMQIEPNMRNATPCKAKEDK